MIDHTSPVWTKLRRHIIATIETRRNALEHDIDPAATAALRGRIAELRALISDVEPSVSPVVSSSEDDQPLYG